MDEICNTFENIRKSSAFESPQLKILYVFDLELCPTSKIPTFESEILSKRKIRNNHVILFNPSFYLKAKYKI